MAVDTLPPPTANPLSNAGKGMAMTRKRFEYKKMTAEEFKADLKEIGLLVKAFARITGSNAERVKKWYYGDEEIPSWVPIFTAMMRNVPGASAEARQEAAKRIVRDLADPTGEEFPYLRKEPDDDD